MYNQIVVTKKNRNELLKKAGAIFPKPVKTGTTIAGIVFKDGVILGADTRATEVYTHFLTQPHLTLYAHRGL